MEQQKYVCYFRVSKQKTRNGNKIELADDYSIESQSRIVNDFIQQNNGISIGVFQEFISGRNDTREQALKAIELCKKENATFLVAKFSRGLRSLPFLVMLRNANVDFKAVDFKDANRLMINIMTCVYEYQAEEIGRYVKESLAIALEKRNGVNWRKVNFTNEGRRKAAQSKSAKFLKEDYLRLGSYIKSLQSNGLGTTRIADEIKKSPFANLIPDINKNKVESLLRVQSRISS